MGNSRSEAFYVFYNEQDFVVCCGTAKQLVEDGRFKDVAAVHQKASHIKSGANKGDVVILK